MKANRLFINILGILPLLLFLIFSAFLMNYVRQTRPEDAIGEVSETESMLSDTAYNISFSKPSGFYSEDFLLTITAPDYVTVYYTLDGSEPDNKSMIYTEPLMITESSWQGSSYSSKYGILVTDGPVPDENDNKACILRAVGIDEKGVSTEIETATYFVGYDAGHEDYSTLSIVTDPDNLFDSSIGIYVRGDGYDAYVANGGDPTNELFSNFYRKGPAWERPAHIDFFDTEQSYLFSQETGLRINGNASRSATQKSLRLYARKKYDGNSRFIHSFFEDGLYEKSVILRGGGFANQFLPTLVDDRRLDTQKFVPCVLFLNGVYWGKYYILERYDAAYVESRYKVASDNITMLKDGELFEGSPEIYNTYQDLLDYISVTDLSIQENYDYVCSQLDMQSYIDYYCTQIYLNNYDFSSSKNIVMWRSNEADEQNPYADNRWRYSLMDLDFTLTAYGDMENYKTNSFSDPYAVAVQTEEILLRNLLTNKEFRRQFVTTFLDLENVNFASDTVAKQIDSYDTFIQYPDIWKEFFEKRPEYINGYLADTFSLSGTLTDVTLTTNNISYGSIQINTVVPDLNSGSWTGVYYSDYPVTLTALPKDGYRFKNWVINGISDDSPELSISLADGDISVSAIFEAEN